MAEIVGRDAGGGAAAAQPGRLPRGPRSTPEARGIIIADTKFEWGRLPDGEMILIDEVLTPDSSRFWPADQYRAGQQPAVVRQAVRARLAGDDRLGQEQPAAGAARRRRGADPAEVPGSVPALDGATWGHCRSLTVSPNTGLTRPKIFPRGIVKKWPDFRGRFNRFCGLFFRPSSPDGTQTPISASLVTNGVRGNSVRHTSCYVAIRSMKLPSGRCFSSVWHASSL